MLWRVTNQRQINGIVYYDVTLGGRIVLAEKMYNECRRYILTHATNDDQYQEDPIPGFDIRVQTIVELKGIK